MVSWPRLRRGRRTNVEVPRVGDPRLVVVVSGEDEEVASSTALDAAGFVAPGLVVLRHTMWLPAGAIEAAVARCAAAGYLADESVVGPTGRDGLILFAAAQAMTVDAVVLSRERARMASMASRAGGHIAGWSLLQASDTA